MDVPVIIVGGGPVGLALALGLARRAIHSIVLERKLEPVEETRALVIWPRTQEILRDWGAYDALRAQADFVTRFTALNARTHRALFSVDFTVLADVVDDPGVLVLPQYSTERILRDYVAASPFCDLRLGAEVTRIVQEDTSVEVSIQSAGGEQTLHASYVVGCDGASGIVAQQIGMSLEGITYDSRMLLSDELLQTPLEEDALVRLRFDQQGIRSAVRFAPNRWRMMASIPKDVPDETAQAPELHAARLRDIFGEHARAKTLWSRVFPIHRRQAQRFVVGRVILAGDAAHLNSPAGGQGMNAGIQDAANVAWKLAGALSGHGDGAALLSSYDIERREMVTDTIERYTDRLARTGIGFPPRAKQFVVRAATRAVRGRGMQRKLARGLSMLSGRYSHSPIVDARHPLAGRRIDDLRLDDGIQRPPQCLSSGPTAASPR